MAHPVEGNLGSRTTAITNPARENPVPRPVPLAELRDVGKRFGATAALTDVSMTITAGTSHALVGRNGAGKSTLVAILTGILEPDTGQVLINGQVVPPVEQRRARTEITCVYQQPTIVPALTVTENLLLGGPALPAGLIRWRKLHRQAGDILEQWRVPVRPTALAGDLTVEQRQLVEIARALSQGSKLVILDEPTAQLDRRASSRLFGQMRALQAAGVTFLYISHHLHEVYEVCQDVTVLRDGRIVAAASAADLPMPRLVQVIAGGSPAADLGQEKQPAAVGAAAGSGAILRAEGLGLAGHFSDVNLAVCPGEIVAVAGLTSSGKVELAETVVGLRRASSGNLLLNGTMLTPGRIDAAIARGIGFVPEDRHASGFAPQLSVAENLASSVLPRLGRWGWSRRTAMTGLASRLADQLQIVTAGVRAPVSELSGGNQQKVVMGRALASSPQMLVLISPTVGVDIASKKALHAVIREARADGTGVLLVTDDSDELALADRVLVMYQGGIAAEFTLPWREEDIVAAIEGVTESTATVADSQPGDARRPTSA